MCLRRESCDSSISWPAARKERASYAQGERTLASSGVVDCAGAADASSGQSAPNHSAGDGENLLGPAERLFIRRCGWRREADERLVRCVDENKDAAVIGAEVVAFDRTDREGMSALTPPSIYISSRCAHICLS